MICDAKMAPQNSYLLKEDITHMFIPKKGDTVIGNDVWVGQNAVILPGVHIGDGCIIGANSVVGSDVPLYSVAVGNPAKVIRKRFDDEMIELLEKLQWWNLSEKQIQNMIPILSNSDIDYVKEEIKVFLKI